ncbi:hypothetical protein [Kistimonas asteriae]|uniref:hypothetical protein n=1 Tax=Kistimonas asteriae TaxID=517724 RepID=UPI001BADF82E|nr:hypothetical protein [Kistimonas asteriae]
MTQVNNNGPIGPADPTGQPGSTGKPTGQVDQKDADAFANMMDGDDTAQATQAGEGTEETTREEFEELFRRNSFQQFMEQSKKLVDEAKKNTEG